MTKEGMMSLKFSRAVLLFVTLYFAWTISSAEEPASLTFNLPGHGKLLLAVPASWNSEVHPRAGEVPPTLELSQKSGASFHVLLTPLWTPGSDTPFPTDEATVKNALGMLLAATHVLPTV
jgi:hypothetical protein